jgi:hypothetical protein
MNEQKMMGGKFVGVDGATEADMLSGIDPGVSRLVKWLRDSGFHTTDSGDGKTKLAQGFTEDDGVCPYAHVVISIKPAKLVSEADRLAALLWETHGITVEPLGPEETEQEPPRIEANYCAANSKATILLYHVDDMMLAKETKQ